MALRALDLAHGRGFPGTAGRGANFDERRRAPEAHRDTLRSRRAAAAARFKIGILADDDDGPETGAGLDLLVRTAAVAVMTARGDLLQDSRGLLNASGPWTPHGLASTVGPLRANGFWTAYAGVRPQLERAY